MTYNTASTLTSTFSRTNYADLSDDYQAAYDWFQSYGFNVAVTRLSRYKGCIDELAKHYRNGTLKAASFKRNFANQVTSLSEATEIIRIHRGLAALYSSGLRGKLQVVLSGQDGRPSVSDFDPGRDTAFELLLASRCHRAGLQVEIGAVADLVILLNNAELFVECKRLKSNEKIRKRIKNAMKQLHRRYKTARNPLTARGIVALSITDSSNPEHGLMIGHTMEEVSAKVQRHVDHFVTQHQSLWHQVEDKRTIGILVELSTPSVVESENLLTTCHEVAINNSCPQGTPDMALLKEFATNLAEQVA